MAACRVGAAANLPMVITIQSRSTPRIIAAVARVENHTCHRPRAPSPAATSSGPITAHALSVTSPRPATGRACPDNHPKLDRTRPSYAETDYEDDAAEILVRWSWTSSGLTRVCRSSPGWSGIAPRLHTGKPDTRNCS